MVSFLQRRLMPFLAKTALTTLSGKCLVCSHKETQVDTLTHKSIFTDKIYSDFSSQENKQQEQKGNMFTPVKVIKGENLIITQKGWKFIFYRDLKG